jgi:hypothetical protein
MSYCAPLKDLPAFQWDSTKENIHAITVLRDPVDRVWSMFRFQTKGCYQWYVFCIVLIIEFLNSLLISFHSLRQHEPNRDLRGN